MQIILAFGNICIMTYAFSKFLSKPHDSLEQRVETLEQKVSKIETSSTSNSDNIDRVTTALTALVDFEMAYCINTHYDADGINDLRHAKKVLRGEVDC
jgi:hypothetical protein